MFIILGLSWPRSGRLKKLRYMKCCMYLKLILDKLILKGKAVPLLAWKGPEGSRKLRLTDFVTTAQDGGRLSALRTGRLCPMEILLVLISVRAESTPGPLCDRMNFISMSYPLTPAGIEPIITVRELPFNNFVRNVHLCKYVFINTFISFSKYFFIFFI